MSLLSDMPAGEPGDDGRYPQGSWVRYPHGSRHEPYTLAEGALLYVKEGHLPPR